MLSPTHPSRQVNYVMLKSVPMTLTPGTKVPVGVEYDLVTG